MGAAIVGLGRCLPRAEVSSAELEARFGLPEGWIEERTGITTRHIAGPGDSVVSLAESACARALEHAGVRPDSVDGVIVATCTADTQIPAVAPVLGSLLGCGRPWAFDMNAACSGFLYALNVATALVDGDRCRTVIVCGVDLMSRVADPDDPRSYVLFGDGAGAVVVTAWGTDALGPFELAADGARPELLYVDPARRRLVMDGREVYRSAVDAMATTVASICGTAGVRPEQLDLVVAHQANARILAAVGTRLGLPDRALISIGRVGNTSAASIPLALMDAAATGRLATADRVALTAFGAGFTWGAGLARWVAPQVEPTSMHREAAHV